MRSRKNQYTITCNLVHDRAAAVVQQHVGLQDSGYKCRASVLLNVLFFAVSRITSVFAACRNLADAPTQQAVFNALVATLPEYDELQKRLNAALVDGLPKALRRRPQTLAIDLTLIPYHGQPQRDPREIYRSQPKDGTSHFHAYATCYVVRKGHRFSVALTPVQKGEPMEDVVQRLLRAARAGGVKCRLLLLDRGFYSVAMIRYLQAARCPFLMPVIRRGRKPTEGKPPTGTRAFAKWKKSDQLSSDEPGPDSDLHQEPPVAPVLLRTGNDPSQCVGMVSSNDTFGTTRSTASPALGAVAVPGSTPRPSTGRRSRSGNYPNTCTAT